MEMVRVKEKFLNSDVKTKVLLFLGIALLAIALPQTMLLPLGVLLVLVLMFESLWSGILYIFSTAFRFVVAFAALLVALYLIMLVVVYFFT